MADNGQESWMLIFLWMSLYKEAHYINIPYITIFVNLFLCVSWNCLLTSVILYSVMFVIFNNYSVPHMYSLTVN